MSISRASTLSEPAGTDEVAAGTLAYFRARLKQRIYSLAIKEFKKSGLSQADLARRLGKEPAQVSRLLSGPGNLTLETVSDLAACDKRRRARPVNRLSSEGCARSCESRQISPTWSVPEA